MTRLISACIVLLLVSCDHSETTPLPSAQLALSYDDVTYQDISSCAFSLPINTAGTLQRQGPCNIKIDYPATKASIFMTYQPVRNNLDTLLRDTQKLSYEHARKASGIKANPFIKPDTNVYGMLYEVSGNAASSTQFYATDSTKHFLAGSVYFDTRPNYDSLYPAIEYMRNDVAHIMEQLRWND